MAGEPNLDQSSVGSRVADLSPGKRALIERLLRARQAGAPAAAIPRRPEPGSAPLSYAQRRMWFLDQLYPGSAALNCDFAVRVNIPYDAAVLERVLTEIVRRHETLRTVFRQEGADVMQVINPAGPVSLPVVDLSHLEPEVRETEAVRLSTEEARLPFDLTRGPLLRTKLLRLAEDDFVLLITLHHIVADYSSMLVFSEELKNLYLAYSVGLPSPLEDLPFQYADFAYWQTSESQSGLLASQLAYWRAQLEDLPRLRLPTDRPHAATATWEGAKYAAPLPVELLDRLREVARQQDCSLFILLLAAFQVLLYRYSGQCDIPVGVPIANRTQAGSEKLIGFFVNSLVVRARLTPELTFAEALARVRAASHGAFANQDLPFERLVEELHPERDPTLHPLFQVAFQSVQVPDSGPTAARVGVERGTATIDLAAEIEEHPRNPILRFEYSTALFDQDTIVRMTGHLLTLLEAIAVNPGQGISELPLLTGSESQRLLNEWNTPEETQATAGGDGCLHEMIERQAAAKPEAVAILASGTGRTLSYRELNILANRFAQALSALGIGPESRVAVCGDRSPELIGALLGVLKSGAAYVPIDPAYPASRKQWIARDAAVSAVIAAPKAEQGGAFGGWGVPVIALDEPPPAGEAPEPVDSGVRPDHLAYLIYTSGSTGMPKAVMVEHRAIVNQLVWMQERFPLGPEDGVLQKYSVSFDASLWEIFGTLAAGARLILAEPGRHADPEHLVDLMAKEGVTALDTVPSLAGLLLDEGLQQRCPRLRLLTCGGEIMPPQLLARLRAWPGLVVNNMYGPTETTVTAACWTDDGRSGIDNRVPIGRAAAGARIYVLDPNGNLAPIGVPGEIHIGGPGLARGYWRRPDLTQAKFVPDPFGEAADLRLFRTGDLGRYLADGNLEFLGRLDQQVKIRGFRVEPGEVEAALARHPNVGNCAVVVQGHEAGARLAAYVAPQNLEIEFWPSVGEYFIYDELLYHAMTHDEGRTSAYRRAIAASVRGKTVVEIGTGADAVLARHCVEEGAERVYAIEMLDSAYEQARATVSRLGLDGRIVLLKGSSTAIELPEKVDVCVSELIGTIGSSEGVIPVLNDARRFLKDRGAMIPRRSITRAAAVSLPGASAIEPRFTPVTRHYAGKVFEAVGYPFDVRVCVKNLPPSSVVSESDVFEDLDFSAPVPLQCSRPIRLRITADGPVDGLLLWLNLFPDGDENGIDVLAREHSWLPVFLPVFSPRVEARAGDVIEAACQRVSAPGGGWCPDYVVEGVLRRSSGGNVEFRYESFHSRPVSGRNEFYRALLGDADGRGAQTEERERAVGEWRDEYERLYRSAADAPEPEFNTAGWDSTYTGAPLSREEMREQVDGAVSRILGLAPRRVLEIGCGTGLLLFPLLRHVESYTGTDFSQAALDYVARRLPADQAAKVTLSARAADDFSGWPPASFDTVILNSVVQYFPNAAYLSKVIEGALTVLAPGGNIFAGDVRNLELLESFHASIESFRAAAEILPGAELGERARARMARERELVVDPRFFVAVARRSPAIRGVYAWPKRGRARNELTCFRYDAVLSTAAEGEAVDGDALVTWDARPETGDVMAAIRRLLEEGPAALTVTGIENARIDTVASTRAAAVEPEDLWQLAGECGYDLELSLPIDGGPPDTLDAFYVRPTVPGAGGGRRHFNWLKLMRDSEALVAEQLTNAPAVRPPSGRELASSLRAYLRDLLPEYLVPSSIVVLDRLPLTAGGKVDRSALPAEEASALSQSSVEFAAPRTELEQKIAEAWARVLGMNRIGLNDNFFDLGGHSLLLVRLLGQLRANVSPELSLMDLFRYPTVRALANHVA